MTASELPALLGGTPTRDTGWPRWPQFDEREEKALLTVLRSRRWWRHGHAVGVTLADAGQRGAVMQFERAFAEAHHCKFGITTTNGTVSIEIALRAAGIKPGDEVIVPAYSFVATAAAPLSVGAVPIFVDIEEDTYCMDVSRVAEAITTRTRAVIPVHWGGQPCAMDQLNALARRDGIVVLEDAAHAHGSSYGGRRAGSLGDMGSFSFQSSKTMTAGEGGIITTNDADLAERCESLVSSGRHRGQPWYCHFELASNARMTEFQGAVLSVQLERLDEQVRRRMGNANVLDNLLGQLDGVQPLAQRSTTTENSHYLYMFRYNPRAFAGLPKSRFVEAVQAEGITGISGGYIWPIYRNPMFLERHFWGGPFPLQSEVYPRDLDYGSFAAECPVSEKACQTEAIWISHETLLADEEDMQDIAFAVGKVQRNAALLM